ncbi:MAG TPA: hypothetical protein VH372_12450, partial [Actinospica sp.]|nr:hypothetical protein [Actinospica sp.]
GSHATARLPGRCLTTPFELSKSIPQYIELAFDFLGYFSGVAARLPLALATRAPAMARRCAQIVAYSSLAHVSGPSWNVDSVKPYGPH